MKRSRSEKSSLPSSSSSSSSSSQSQIKSSKTKSFSDEGISTLQKYFLSIILDNSSEYKLNDDQKKLINEIKLEIGNIMHSFLHVLEHELSSIELRKFRTFIEEIGGYACNFSYSPPEHVTSKDPSSNCYISGAKGVLVKVKIKFHKTYMQLLEDPNEITVYLREDLVKKLKIYFRTLTLISHLETEFMITGDDDTKVQNLVRDLLSEKKKLNELSFNEFVTKYQKALFRLNNNNNDQKFSIF